MNHAYSSIPSTDDLENQTTYHENLPVRDSVDISQRIDRNTSSLSREEELENAYDWCITVPVLVFLAPGPITCIWCINFTALFIATRQPIAVISKECASLTVKCIDRL